MDPISIISTIGTISSLIPPGWFSCAKWTPTKIDEAMDKFRQLHKEGVITDKEWQGLVSRKKEARDQYHDQHDAMPWNKGEEMKDFQRAVNNFYKYARAVSQKVKERVKKQQVGAGGGEYLAWVKEHPYVVAGGAFAFVTLIAVVAAKKG